MRFVLIDYLHLAYKCYGAQPLSCIVNIDGVDQVVDTTIPNFTCKDVWRFSGAGKHPTGVFLEGGAFIRKAYFSAVNDYKAEKLGIASNKDSDGYKAGRKGLASSQKTGVQLAQDRLVRGNISCYQVDGYEADDLIYIAVQQLKQAYPDAYIDIITGDMDMLPLVDDKVSVYMRGTRTYAEPMCCTCASAQKYTACDKYPETCKYKREFKGYYQVTPKTWDDFIYYRSAFKGCPIPYNAILLYKMLKGDVSDNIPMAEKGYGAKKLNALFDQMKSDGVDFAKVFRYDTPWETIEGVLKNYFSPDTIQYMYLNFQGLRPRNNMGELINCMPFVEGFDTIDVADVYQKVTSGTTYYPKTLVEQRKAMQVALAAQNGIRLGNSLTLRVPTQPDRGQLQSSLNSLRINLPDLRTAL